MTELLTQDTIGGLKRRKASESDNKPSILIYGGSGIGKTTFAASACEVEELSPVLFIDLENGTLSISEIYPDLDVLEVKNFRQLQLVYDDLRKNGCYGYKTVVLDNLTETMKKGMEYHFAKTSKEPPTSFTDFSTGSWGDGSWKVNNEQMRRLIRNFRDLSVSTIFTAWIKDYGKESSHDWGPAFAPAFAKEIPGLVNDCYRYHMKGGDRILETAISENAAGKDRTRKLPPTISSPTMKIIWEYWTGQRVYKPEPKTDNRPNVNKPGSKK